jgi:hypothetical protein
MALIRGHDLDDATGGQQAPESLVGRIGQSTSLAALDHRGGRVGPVADEHSAVDSVRAQSSEVARFLTECEILAAHAQFGRLDLAKVKAGMGPNWPPNWDGIAAGEGIFYA